MRSGLIVLALCLAALIAGAALYFFGPAVVPAPSVPVEGEASMLEAAQPVPFSVLEEGQHAAQVADRKNYAARDADSFKKLWNMAHGTDGTSLPAVDFSRYYVIALFMGQVPTGGYAVSATGVADAGDTRTVSVKLTKPGANCIVNQAVMRPYQFILVPQSAVLLAHRDASETVDCAN